MGRRVPVLTYHSLDCSGSPLSISPALFRWQMGHLKTEGWRTLTVDQLLSGHQQGEWPERSLMLTFDDGFQNVAEQGAPVLEDLGFTAVLFVVAGWAGRSNDWPGQPGWVPRRPLMGWGDLRRLAGQGIEVGAHTMSHPHLAALGEEEGRREILDGTRRIEDRLGYALRAFAYPYGESTHSLERLVADHFQVGFTTRLRFAAPSDRASVLPRVDIYYLRHPRLFQAMETGWLSRYLLLRRWIGEKWHGRRWRG